MWLKPVFIFSDYGYVISEIRNVNNDGFDLREKLVCCLVELSASSFATAEKKSEMTKFHREILKMYNNSIWTNGSGFFVLFTSFNNNSETNAHISLQDWICH